MQHSSDTNHPRSRAAQEQLHSAKFDAVPPRQTSLPQLPTYAAPDLTRGGDLAQIVQGNQTYTLRITRAGKLILTK